MRQPNRRKGDRRKGVRPQKGCQTAERVSDRRKGVRNRYFAHKTQTSVPDTLSPAAKMGFAVPIAAWLRGPLRDWAEALIDERRLRDEGFLAAPPIREKWKQHLGGERDWSQYLWDVLMFQAWRERWA